jgi:hypothetical protein
MNILPQEPQGKYALRDADTTVATEGMDCGVGVGAAVDIDNGNEALSAMGG